jgi:hypothetical protein
MAPKKEPEFPSRRIADKYAHRRWDGARGCMVVLEARVQSAVDELGALAGAMKYARETEDLRLARELFAKICLRVANLNGEMLEKESNLYEEIKSLAKEEE